LFGYGFRKQPTRLWPASNQASQAMLINGNDNLRQPKTALATAHNFLIDKASAHAMIAHQITTIQNKWDEVCTESGLNDADKQLLWQRQFLNPFSMILD